MKIRKSLLSMNSSSTRKYISHKTRKILSKEHQLNLLSQIEKEKCKIEKIKLNIRNLYLFVTTKDDIRGIQVSNSLINKIKGIISTLCFICNATSKDKDRTNLNKKKKDNTENVLLALYYANQRLFKVTENEIQ
ncbi:fam-j protein [Plasmodium relictum]|uniref:Fam-j protein n=1 Tax=Plasmodium relictum TaxID=85471 RepID=A0A1J1GKT8_PLARL|nr:fam-j protein [Plasmodium relictum]CRG85084.1 fam-j protein [Plasmodium relictum]